MKKEEKRFTVLRLVLFLEGSRNAASLSTLFRAVRHGKLIEPSFQLQNTEPQIGLGALSVRTESFER